MTAGAYSGVRDVRASSSGSDVTATFLAGAGHSPFAALDGDPSTFWDSANSGSPQGQWIEVDLDHPVTATAIKVLIINGPFLGGAVKSLQVTTDGGSFTVEVPSGDASQSIPPPPGPTTRIRLTVAEASGAGLFAV